MIGGYGANTCRSYGTPFSFGFAFLSTCHAYGVDAKFLTPSLRPMRTLRDANSTVGFTGSRLPASEPSEYFPVTRRLHRAVCVRGTPSCSCKFYLPLAMPNKLE